VTFHPGATPALSAVLLISIVDDDPAVGQATARLLESYGYATLVFASAEEFLQSKQLKDTDCVISDIRMPGLNGIELQNRLIQGGYNIPTIFATAYPEAHVRRAAMNNGAVCFLAKPAREERLIACIERALRSRARL
jgi:FixJ family two-component response regulator